jgi:hypothetical protein
MNIVFQLISSTMLLRVKLYVMLVDDLVGLFVVEFVARSLFPHIVHVI